MQFYGHSQAVTPENKKYENLILHTRQIIQKGMALKRNKNIFRGFINHGTDISYIKGTLA
ncbi:MAG: hypothetical protein A2017_20550 [Lentisphaerae bacterium GWF2_44_16]|nr:MAG: hypothetical protein A2017_20550 [Lentisphaerae bacterium GWF2_44_16]